MNPFKKSVHVFTSNDTFKEKDQLDDVYENTELLCSYNEEDIETNIDLDNHVLNLPKCDWGCRWWVFIE